jgi:hypothetical protein
MKSSVASRSLVFTIGAIALIFAHVICPVHLAALIFSGWKALAFMKL